MLTHDELLSMPETAYMNAGQLAFFKKLLLSQLEALQANMQLTSVHLHEQQEMPDPTDRAT